MVCGVVLFVVLAFVPAGIFANKVEDDEETCRRYANGQVYPEKTTISEHAVHWSKAQSKSESIRNVALSPFSCVCMDSEEHFEKYKFPYS